jgi:peptide/nickel transport system substrate-binding protein
VHRRSLLPTCLALPILLAGCFAGPPGGPSDDAVGDRLRVVLPFPPAQALSPFGDDALILTRLGVAEPLVALDESGAPVPALARSWTRVDDITWRFALLPDITFHDGTPVTAEHAANALSAATQASPPPRALRGITLTASAEDDATLTVRTDVADPVLLQRLSSPNLVVLAPAAYGGPNPDPAGTGTGPFVLRAADGGGATLDAFTGYRDGPPAAAGVDARFVPDATARAGAIRAGEADVAAALPVAQASQLDGAQLIEVPLPRDVFLHLNASGGTFADPALRAAAREAVDEQWRAELVASVFEGRADPARGVHGPASPWAAQRPDIEEAQAAAPAGASVRLATYSDRAELPETAGAVAERLRSAGFAVTETVREYSELEPDLLAGAFDAVVAARSYLLDTGDPAGFLASDVTCEGSYNLSRLCDPAVDAAVAAAQGPADLAARREAALAAEAAVLRTDALLPLVHERARIGVAPGVGGVAEDPFERLLVTTETRRR